MEYNSVFFPVIVLLGIFLVILSARFIFRIMLAFLAILIIWFGLYILGVAPSPINYFKKQTPSKEVPVPAHIFKNFSAR